LRIPDLIRTVRPIRPHGHFGEGTVVVETRTIGALEVSVIGLGCNNFGGRIDEARSSEVVLAALDAGVTFFDTADIYGSTQSETFIGRALAGRRDEAIIATKFGNPLPTGEHGARPEYVHRAADASLARLGVEYIDLYQLHTPDPETPIAETLGALNELIAAGKVREIGCSNFSVAQLEEAEAAIAPGQRGFVSVQNEYSLLARGAKRDVLPFCEQRGIGFLPFFPLACGMLTGKYTRGAGAPAGTRLANAPAERQERAFSDANFAVVEALTAFAVERGHSLLELAFARLIAESSIPSVIAGATSPTQVDVNVAAAGAWNLTAEEIAEIDRLAPIP
jgi:aryl-alcohol dehydrogenase-like predicted oxidoreductase